MKIKKILLIIVSITFLFSFIDIKTSGNDCYNWYIKRNKGGTPLFPSHAEEIREYDVYYIDESAVREGKKVIYLTFDVGYENGNVERILDALKEENISAAFFVLDNVIIKNTELVNRMFDDGHLVCNHTKDHKNLSHASKETTARNLTALEKICEEKTGKEMFKYFRFPEGSYSIESLKNVQELGYKTIFWSFAYDDWDNHRQPNTEKAIKKILENTHNGAIMLFHPTSKTNADIFQSLIQEWKCQGYTFGTLDQLTSK